MNQEALECIRADFEAGTRSPDILSLKYAIDIREVEHVIAEMQANEPIKSNVEVLRDNLGMLRDLVGIAEVEYKGSPNVDNSTAFVQLIQTTLATIKEIEARKDPAVIMNEILAKAVQPMIRQYIRYATLAVSNARADLYQQFPREHHGKIDQALKGVLKDVGKYASVDYKQTVVTVAEILECKPEDEKVTVLRTVGEQDDSQEEKAETADRST